VKTCIALLNYRVVDKTPVVKRDPEAIVSIRGWMYKQVCHITWSTWSYLDMHAGV